MTIQEAKDQVAEVRKIDILAEPVSWLLRQRELLYKKFVASVAAGTCEDPQAVAKIIWDM